jgi:hypothetical protein
LENVFSTLSPHIDLGFSKEAQLGRFLLLLPLSHAKPEAPVSFYVGIWRNSGKTEPWLYVLLGFCGLLALEKIHVYSACIDFGRRSTLYARALFATQEQNIFCLQAQQEASGQAGLLGKLFQWET